MKRKSTYFTPLSLGITLFLFFTLAIVVWRSGGLPFNPGRVTAKAAVGQSLGGYTTHADFEAKCSLCHQPFGKAQAELCMQCHQDVANQVNSKTGIHGAMDQATACASCHPEHRGRSFDPTTFALAEFDHGLTGFVLTGKHVEAQCSDCHPGGRYLNTPRDCNGCHAGPDTHQGLYTQDCSTCHTTASWKPAWMNNTAFEHNQASFSLVKHAVDYANKPIPCTACHTGQEMKSANLQGCVSCHSTKDATFMDTHQVKYGPDCLQCHDGQDRMHGFTHNQVFVLDGSHAALTCDACHANYRFKDTPAACSSCHAEPSIHAGFFGLQCADCHNSSAWKPAHLTVHAFPLNHGQASDVDCLNCHPKSYAEYTCYGCHDHQAAEIEKSHSQAGIDAKTLPDCASCHLDGAVHREARKPGEG